MNGSEPIVTIRRAVSADAEMLAQLGARTFTEAFGPGNTKANLAAHLASNFTVARLTEELADPSSRYVVAEIEGEPVGYAKLHWGDAPDSVQEPQQVELSRIYVSADRQGAGVGQALMQRCIDEAREAGAEAIWLSVWQRNPRAVAFYLKWGFRQVGEKIFMVGWDPQTDWVMERDLAIAS